MEVFDYKRRNGQYIGAFAPYGYVKYPKDKHQLIIDPDAAEIVKLIFSLFLQIRYFFYRSDSFVT